MEEVISELNKPPSLLENAPQPPDQREKTPPIQPPDEGRDRNTDPPTIQDIMNKLPVWDVSRVLYNEGIRFI